MRNDPKLLSRTMPIMTHSVFHQLALLIEERTAGKSGAYIVAIDGRSGAGKSSLAAALSDRLDASVLEGDDFFAGGVVVLERSSEELADICIDWRSQRDVLQALKTQGQATYFPFDWTAFDGTKSRAAKHVRSADIVFVEGVYAARPQLRPLIDFSVLIELPDALRMRRLLTREAEIGPWERQWHRAEDWYFANRSPRKTFDAILTWHTNEDCTLDLRPESTTQGISAR